MAALKRNVVPPVATASADESAAFLRQMDGPVRVRVRRFDAVGKVIFSEVLKVPAGSLAELMRRCAAKRFA